MLRNGASRMRSIWPGQDTNRLGGQLVKRPTCKKKLFSLLSPSMKEIEFAIKLNLIKSMFIP
jgi:hypothetical protein